jgi:hypothetical protein
MKRQAIGGTVSPFVFRFYRSASDKNEKRINKKYHAAVHPKPDEATP